MVFFVRAGEKGALTALGALAVGPRRPHFIHRATAPVAASRNPSLPPPPSSSADFAFSEACLNALAAAAKPPRQRPALLDPGSGASFVLLGRWYDVNYFAPSQTLFACAFSAWLSLRATRFALLQVDDGTGEAAVAQGGAFALPCCR